jgi:DNA-binding transcriptional ArsR family regulator
MQKVFSEKESKRLEIFTKGYASKRRIVLLTLVAHTPHLTVEELAERSQLGYETVAVHLQKLERAGLVAKRYSGLAVKHACTKRGALVLKHLAALAKS